MLNLSKANTDKANRSPYEKSKKNKKNLKIKRKNVNNISELSEEYQVSFNDKS